MDRCWSFKLWQVANDGQQPFIRDVQGSELQELSLLF